MAMMPKQMWVSLDRIPGMTRWNSYAYMDVMPLKTDATVKTIATRPEEKRHYYKLTARTAVELISKIKLTQRF